MTGYYLIQTRVITYLVRVRVSNFPSDVEVNKELGETLARALTIISAEDFRHDSLHHRSINLTAKATFKTATGDLTSLRALLQKFASNLKNAVGIHCPWVSVETEFFSQAEDGSRRRPLKFS